MTYHSNTTQRFGEWLRTLREARSLPLRVVAAAGAMDQAHLSKVELGHRMLTMDQARMLARYFHIDATEMEARRIAEKFRQDYSNNPAVEQAIYMLYENMTAYGAKK